MKWVELGRIGGPFGVKGWVHVQSFTRPPERLFEYSVWHVSVGAGERTPRRLLEGRSHGQHLVARLEDIGDREAAAALRGGRIEVARHELPPAGERQFYQVDLIGLRVRNLEDVELGVVQHFVDAPANSVMVVRGKREHWVPATRRHLREVDLQAGTITVDWPAELD